MRAGLAGAAGCLLAGCGQQADVVAPGTSAPDPLQSGYEFLQADTQALQDDATRYPPPRQAPGTPGDVPE